MFDLIHQDSCSECQEEKINLIYYKSRFGNIYRLVGYVVGNKIEMKLEDLGKLTGRDNDCRI